MPTASARAVRFDRYGGLDVLYVADVPMPEPGPGEVVVQVRAAGINPGEAAIREGAMDPEHTGTFPSGEGSDLAGVVVAAAPDVTAFRIGDEVLGYSWTRSSHATHAAVPATQLIRKPAGLSWEVAGALYVIGVTAYAAARAVNAGQGDVVAVSASAGGVGRVLTQLLVHRGARVLGIASAANADWLTRHGATPVEYGDGLIDRLRAAAPDGVDAFIDLHGPEYLDLAVDLGVALDRIETIISFEKAGQIGAKAEGSTDASTPEVMQEMADLVSSGVIEIDIAGTYSLEEVAEAFSELSDGHTQGKIVLIPGRAAVLGALQQVLSSEVVLAAGSADYQAAASPDNTSFRQTPDAVVRPRTGADIARAVQAARNAGAQVMVQATGHGAGVPVGAGVILVDTSEMDSVQVDAAARVVRAGAGAVWSKVQEQAWPHRLLALSGTSPTVGVSGYTFHGGVGWLARPFGLASGSLRSVDYVDGRGQVRHAAEDRPDQADRDALWAFRGGAPVGIATELEFGLYPVADLWAGYLLWPGDQLPALAAAWAGHLAEIPDALTSDLSLLALPPAGPFPDALKGTTVVHLSYASIAGEAGLAGLRAALRAAAEPAVDTTGPADPAKLAQIHLDPPGGIAARGVGQWLTAAPADLVVALADAARIGQPGGLNVIEFRHVGPGADLAARPVPDGALTSVPGPFLLHAVGLAPDDAARARVDAVLKKVLAAAAPADTGLSAPTFREGQPDDAGAFRPEVERRLRAISAELDPDGVLAFVRGIS
ncbi:MAG: FAD-binding protein [Actinobacteria bacterium]|nr:FAD-binding protein [Actinomycetota bacterium]